MDHTNTNTHMHTPTTTYRYKISGSSAHTRITPILRSIESANNVKFVQCEGRSDVGGIEDGDVKFMWENTPTSYSKKKHLSSVPPTMSFYNHLPNHTILDSKFTLALLSSTIQTLGSSCGVVDSSLCVNSSKVDDFIRDVYDTTRQTTVEGRRGERPNMWVIKDAETNGAGGIWILSSANYRTFLDPLTSPLKSSQSCLNARYVVQRYSYPLMLVEGRKAHIRLYGLLKTNALGDAEPWISRHAFLHVSNKPFCGYEGGDEEDGEIHISNCCANSDNKEAFRGEICINLEEKSSDVEDDNLYNTWGPIKQAVRGTLLAFSKYTSLSSPPSGYTQASYLGIDVIITKGEGETKCDILEINAPPSLDTATGIEEAEMTHEGNVGGIFKQFVEGCKVEGEDRWVRLTNDDNGDGKVKGPGDTVENSKTATEGYNALRSESINKLKYNLYERKMLKSHAHLGGQVTSEVVQGWGRKRFRYFKREVKMAFFENAGGSQVPERVVDRVKASLENRWREVEGKRSKVQSKEALKCILGLQEGYDIYYGSNSTEIFKKISERIEGTLGEGDEILVSTCNHTANYKPWVEVAKRSGAKFVGWDVISGTKLMQGGYVHAEGNVDTVTSPPPVTGRTKVLVMPHSSNVFGVAYDLNKIIKRAREIREDIIVVIDGVAAVPHRYAAEDAGDADFYVVSCHKCFGPHLGAVAARRKTVERLGEGTWERGTNNFEACEGVAGLLEYFLDLSRITMEVPDGLLGRILDGEETGRRWMREAYEHIELAESRIASMLLDRVRFKWDKVALISHYDDDIAFSKRRRMPIVTFAHKNISSQRIVKACEEEGIVIRAGFFLSEVCFKSWADNWKMQGGDASIVEGVEREGAVRVSMVHYNTEEEVRKLLETLEGIEGW